MRNSRKSRRISLLLTHPQTEDQQLLLDDLNDDVLAIIVDYLFDMDELNGQRIHLYINTGPYVRTHRSTFNLGVANKRLRSACIRKLFRDIHRCSSTMGQLNRQLKDTEPNSQNLSSIRQTNMAREFLVKGDNVVRTCDIATSSRHDSILYKTRLQKVLPTMPFLKELTVTRKCSTARMFSGTPIDAVKPYPRPLTDTLDRKHVDLSILERMFSKAYHFSYRQHLILRDNLHHDEPMAGVKSLRKLRHLELYDKCWIREDIEHLQEQLPNLESLALKGGIGDQDVFQRATESSRFSSLWTLAVAVDDREERRYESAFSDDSEVAISIVRARLFVLLWRIFGWYNDGSHSAPELRQGSLTARNWGIIGNHFGRDGFPLVLSFPGDITSYDEKHDPPNYGRETPAEWEADKTRERPPKIEIFDRGSSIQDAEKEWYAKR
ncbi:hypothetical protein PSPO01_00684 [Paraphaeosphaeria sporulosa]